MDKLLHNLTGKSERGAQFRTVIALLIGEETQLFEGVVRGTIIKERRGEGGFGYDPIFFYPPYGKTLAEVSAEEKNRVSHRAKALLSFYEKMKEADIC